jgi:hypothetical protein
MFQGRSDDDVVSTSHSLKWCVWASCVRAQRSCYGFRLVFINELSNSLIIQEYLIKQYLESVLREDCASLILLESGPSKSAMKASRKSNPSDEVDELPIQIR